MRALVLILWTLAGLAGAAPALRPSTPTPGPTATATQTPTADKIETVEYSFYVASTTFTDKRRPDVDLAGLKFEIAYSTDGKKCFLKIANVDLYDKLLFYFQLTESSEEEFLRATQDFHCSAATGDVARLNGVALPLAKPK